MDNESTLQAALPGYEIGTELGRGAFGVVVAGRHRQLNRDVAIKLLSPGLVRDDVVRARFLAEARVLAALDHPHIVPVFDYVEQDDACILVMERLVGGTVWRRFVDQGFDQRTACAVAMVACSGLSGAHRHGVLHRDMKPENMLFGTEGVLKVGDFGIARVLGDDDALATRDGEILGTPAYMAPEQASGSDLGPQTDVYATGVMLYELLSGRLPYPETGNFATVLRHINEDPTPLSEIAPSVPPPITEAVMRAIDRDPGERFATAEEFGVAIGSAGSAAWGGGWLDNLRVGIREPGAILASAEPGQSPRVSDNTQADPTLVRPSIDLHALGAAGTGLAISDLMPVRQAPVPVPDFPKRLSWAALAVAVVAVLLGFLGIGSSGPSPALARGSVTVAGHDPAASRVPIDLGRPIPVTLARPPSGIGTVESAELSLSLANLTIVRSTSVPFQTENGTAETFLDASSGRYVLGGHLSGSLRLVGTAGSVTDDFGVAASNSPFSTFVGVVGLVLILMVIAYAESLLRSLRRGRRRDNRTAAIAGLALVGVFGGVGATLLGWMLEVTGPNLVPFLLSGVLGAVAGLLAGLAGARVGERARALRQSHRLVLVARRTAVSTPAAAAGAR